MGLFDWFTKRRVRIKPSRNWKCLVNAYSELDIQEAMGDQDNPTIVEYHAYSTIENKEGMADEIPWCSSFACFVTESSGMSSTNSKAARSWLRWGMSVKQDPLPGDIIIFKRGSSSWQGHVGFYLGLDDRGRCIVLGGNQSNKVCVKVYPMSKMLDIRRSSKSRVYNKQDLNDIYKLRDEILDK